MIAAADGAAIVSLPDNRAVSVYDTRNRLLGWSTNYESFNGWCPQGESLLYATSTTARNRDRTVTSIPWLLDLGQLERSQIAASFKDAYPFTLGGREGQGRFLWSPDCTRLLYMTLRWGLQQEQISVWSSSADGTQPVRIATFPRHMEFPLRELHWSPDSVHFLIVISTRQGVELWLGNADGSSMEFLVDGRSMSVGWSPDGSIGWASVERRELSHQLHIFRPGGGLPHSAWYLASSTSELHPRWSPEGDQLAYITTSAAGDAELFVSN